MKGKIKSFKTFFLDCLGFSSFHKNVNQALIDSTFPEQEKLRETPLHSQDTHLGVCSLGFCNGAVESGAGCESLCQALVDSAQLLGEDSDVVLQSILLLFLLPDLTV